MRQDEVIKAIAHALRDDRALKGLFLAGSHGRETADRFSDIDVLGVVEAQEQADFPERWRAALETIAPLVFWREGRRGAPIINAITDGWTRIDLALVTPQEFASKSQNELRPLVDRNGLFDSLPPSVPPPPLDKARLEFLIQEFIRVLGLLPVAIGRGEVVTSIVGVGLQRDALMQLMIAEQNSPDAGGALHLSRTITAEDMATLIASPYPKPDRAAAIAAHLELARIFLPRARKLAKAYDIPWPSAFEDATRRYLTRELGDAAGQNW